MEASNDRVQMPLALIGTFAALVRTSKGLISITLTVWQSFTYFTVRTVYDLFFGPLARIPGPALSAISRLPHVRDLLRGKTVDTITELHKTYGDVVRFSPNEVSFISIETAFPDIYGFRTGKLKGHVNMQKDSVSSSCGVYPNVAELATS